MPGRYCGPPTSANGGWVAGSLAHELGGTPRATLGRAVVVTLHQPPPLDATMRLRSAAAGIEATFGGALVASATFVEDPAEPIEPVEGVSWGEAQAAATAYAGHRSHPFPTCFVCGVNRDDGLAIFPGAAPSSSSESRLAAPWVPDPTLRNDWHEYDESTPRTSLAAAWAALDCVGGWAGGMAERVSVLGRMTAVVDELPVIGEQHVVTGERRAVEGRKTFTAATLHDADGRIVGRAEHIWIAVER